MESSQSRLLVVSNRLPVTIKRIGKGQYDYNVSSGGLNSGLSALGKEMKFQWFGWPGIAIPEEDVNGVSETLRLDYDAVPVFLEDDLADKHYNGFSSAQISLFEGCC
jgi:trehalose 6-phosphate synthase